MGDLFRNPALAETLRCAIRKGAAGFYSGRVAEALGDSERETLLNRIRLQWPRSEWRSVRERIDDAFESIAKRGFCVSLGDRQPDVFAVGAPVVTAEGAVLAFNCGGMPSEVTAAQLENEIGPRLARAARQISTGRSVSA